MQRWRHTSWLILAILTSGCGGEPAGTVGLPSLRGASLAEARVQHRTRLLEKKPGRDPFTADVPEGVEAVHYPGPLGQNLAWLVRPKGMGPFPAVLYAHAGSSLSKGDYLAAKPFVDAGYVVLLPAWRGENGNPGHYEMWYGEVADAAAALDFLAHQPGVDPQRLYAAGHDSGGTIVLLLAELTPHLRAAAACGALPDLRAFVEEKKGPFLPVTPYDWRDPLESDLRSPARHVRDLACPVALSYGEKDEAAYVAQAAQMQEDALAMGREMLVNRVAGTDHNTAIDRAVPAMVAFFKLHGEGKKP